MTLQEVAPLVEASLAGLKVDPVLCRGQKPGQWSYKLKDATVWIDVFSSDVNQGKWYFQVMSPLCEVPARKSAELFQDVLEINYKLYGSWICKKDGWLYVLSLRETVNIDQSEIDATLDRVAFYSTDYHSKLSFKYEGCWDPKPPVNISGGRAE
jgi:hypothetical protein